VNSNLAIASGNPSFSWTPIQPQRYLLKFRLCVARQVCSFREVLSQLTVRILVRAVLPRALRITEVHSHIRGHREALVFGHFQPAVPGQRAPKGVSERATFRGSALFGYPASEDSLKTLPFQLVLDSDSGIGIAIDSDGHPVERIGAALEYKRREITLTQGLR
jgi:hypothetical protein